MTKGKTHDRDVWGPPTPKTTAADSTPPPLSKFQQHFQDRMSRLDKDDANVLAGAPAPSDIPPTMSGEAKDGRATKAPAKATARPSPKPKGQSNAFVTPDQVRQQQRAEARQKQPSHQQTPSQPPPQPHTTGPPQAAVRPTAAVQKAQDTLPVDRTPLPPTAEPMPAPPVAEPVTAQTVDDFLEQLRLQAEASAPPETTTTSTAAMAMASAGPDPPRSAPALKRRPNSGQRLAPLPTSPPPPTTTAASAASARRDTSASDHAPVDTTTSSGAGAGGAGAGAGAGVRPPDGGAKTRWAAPAPRPTKKTSAPAPAPVNPTTAAAVKKPKSVPAVRPVIDSRNSRPVPASEGHSDVLRLATPKPVTVPKGQTRTSATAAEAVLETPPARRVSYTPYSVNDYRSMMDKAAHEKRGGLGPSDTDAQRLAKERLERQRAYGKKATQHALEVLKADAENEAAEDQAEEIGPEASTSASSTTTTTPRQSPVKPAASPPVAASAPQADVSEDGEGPPRRGSAASSSPPGKPRKRKVLRQPTPESVVRARERRERALAYARDKAAEMAPAPPSPSPHTDADRETADARAKRHRTAAVDAEAAAREQRRLDLEAKHEQQKLAVERIRKQLRA